MSTSLDFSHHTVRTTTGRDMACVGGEGDTTKYKLPMLSNSTYHHYDMQIRYIADLDHHSSLWPKATAFEMHHMR